MAGEIRFDGSPASPERRVPMDSERARPARTRRAGQIERVRSVFTHRRAEIVEITERAEQPTEDPDHGRTLAFDGCICNDPPS